MVLFTLSVANRTGCRLKNINTLITVLCKYLNINHRSVEVTLSIYVKLLKLPIPEDLLVDLNLAEHRTEDSVPAVFNVPSFD